MENIATQATRLLIKVKKIDWTKVKEDGYKHDVFSELYSVIGDGLNEMFDTQELRQKIKEKVKNGRIQKKKIEHFAMIIDEYTLEEIERRLPRTFEIK